jgi:hypothetical protein
MLAKTIGVARRESGLAPEETSIVTRVQSIGVKDKNVLIARRW